MGYDFHITRRQSWFDDDGDAISLDEWKTYVSSRRDIKPDPENPGEDDYIIVTHPEHWPLWWRRGEITTKNPDEEAVAKLVQIARELDARVVGDDGEVYGTDPSNPCAAVPASGRPKKPWWKIW